MSDKHPTSMDELAQEMRARARQEHKEDCGLDYHRCSTVAVTVEAAISVVREGWEMQEVQRPDSDPRQHYRVATGEEGGPRHVMDKWGAVYHILIPKPAPEPKPEPDVREAAIRRAATKFATAIERMEETGRALRAALDTDT